MTEPRLGRGGRWCGHIEGELAIAQPYDVDAARLKRPRTIYSWPKTGTIGAFSTMDVGDPPPDRYAVYRALGKARIKHAASKEHTESLNQPTIDVRKPGNSKAGSNLEELGVPSELPLPPKLGASQEQRPGWLATAIRNIGIRRTA